MQPRVLRAPARLDDPARQLEGYFTGRRRGFDVPLDLRLSAGFRRRVRTIRAYRSYAAVAVAKATGRAQAVRAVGSACATNPSRCWCRAIWSCAPTEPSAGMSVDWGAR